MGSGGGGGGVGACMDGRGQYFACIPTGRIHAEWMIAHKMLQHAFSEMLADAKSTNSRSDCGT